MAELIALEVANAALGGVVQSVVINVGALFMRQMKSISDPSYQCIDLQTNILILEKMLEAASSNSSLAEFCDQINWHMYLAAESARVYKNKPARERFKFLARFEKQLAAHNETLEEDIEELQSKLGDTVDVKAIRMAVKAMQDKSMQKRVGRRVEELIDQIEAAAEAGDEQKAAELYWTLSNILGANVAASKSLRPAAASFLERTHTSDNIEPSPWEEAGPDFLGVLGLRRVMALGPDTVSFDDQHRYMALKLGDATLSSLAQSLQLRDGWRKGLEVKLDPVVPTTVDDFTQNLLLIPPEARYFAFAHPLTGALPPRSDVGKGLLELMLLHGGYLYFDEEMHFLTANCFVSDQSNNPFLCFNGPHELDKTMCDYLLDNDRFAYVTAKDLLRAGARRFCWINPGEDLGSGDPEVWKHGAFAYLFHEGHTERACIYSVASIADMLGVSEKEIANPSSRLLAATTGWGGSTMGRIVDTEGSCACCTIS